MHGQTEAPAAQTLPLTVIYDLVLAADVEEFVVLILLDPSVAFKTVALCKYADFSLASETGQESPTLYLILKMPSDPVQGFTVLIRLVDPGCAQTQAAEFYCERRDSQVLIKSVISC